MSEPSPHPEPLEAILAAETGWLQDRISRHVPEPAVEDVLQEVWLSWWAVSERYREEGLRRAYLARLADRRIVDWYRKNPATVEATADMGTSPFPDPDLISYDLIACGIAEGSILWQRIVDDQSLAALASAHGLPLGTVKSRIHHEGRALRRRLQDWHRAQKGQDVPCEHLRRGLLGVAACARCQEEQAAWEAIRTRSHAGRLFQATSVTVESSLAMWFDCTVSVARWNPGDCGATRADFGPLRRFSDETGRDLSSRVHRRTVAGLPYFTYAMRPGDSRVLQISQHIASGKAAAAGLTAHRSGMDLVLDIHYGEESDGALVVELPLGMYVHRASPSPARTASIHGHTVLHWESCAALPHSPVISGRWL